MSTLIFLRGVKAKTKVFTDIYKVNHEDVFMFYYCFFDQFKDLEKTYPYKLGTEDARINKYPKSPHKLMKDYGVDRKAYAIYMCGYQYTCKKYVPMEVDFYNEMCVTMVRKALGINWGFFYSRKFGMMTGSRRVHRLYIKVNFERELKYALEFNKKAPIKFFRMFCRMHPLVLYACYRWKFDGFNQKYIHEEISEYKQGVRDALARKDSLKYSTKSFFHPASYVFYIFGYNKGKYNLNKLIEKVLEIKQMDARLVWSDISIDRFLERTKWRGTEAIPIDPAVLRATGCISDL